jgi:hypothetical protein
MPGCLRLCRCSWWRGANWRPYHIIGMGLDGFGFVRSGPCYESLFVKSGANWRPYHIVGMGLDGFGFVSFGTLL